MANAGRSAQVITAGLAAALAVPIFLGNMTAEFDCFEVDTFRAAILT